MKNDLIWFDFTFFWKKWFNDLKSKSFSKWFDFSGKKGFFFMVIWTKMILNHFFDFKMILFFSIFLPDWEGCKKWKKVSKLWKNYPYWGKDEVKTGINSGKIILIGDVGLIGTFFFNIPTWFFFLFFNTFFHDIIFSKMILNHWFKINDFDLIWFYSFCFSKWFDLIWLFLKKQMIWFDLI